MKCLRHLVKYIKKFEFVARAQLLLKIFLSFTDDCDFNWIDGFDVQTNLQASIVNSCLNKPTS